MAPNFYHPDSYDRAAEVRAFDESKAGVKGLVDSGITKVPRIFLLPPEARIACSTDPKATRPHTIPTVDIGNLYITGTRRHEVVKEIGEACETWGFFQVTGHVIPTWLLEEVVEGVRSFNEGPVEEKVRIYSRDPERDVRFNSNFDLYQSRVANWRDSLFCRMSPEQSKLDQIPAILRKVMIEYSRQVQKLGDLLFELLSEALGLNSTYLADLELNKEQILLSHYYPPCPEPEVAIGTSEHSDSSCLSVLLQDQIGGLQVRYKDDWVDVHPIPGALVVNLGDLLQLVSNDRFKSVEHRVVAKAAGPRISVACFFRTNSTTRLYGPIKELISEDNPPVYRDIYINEYMTSYYSRGLDGKTALQHFRL